jgi:Ca-activated chloride channel family protein
MDWQHPEALYLIVPLSALWLGVAIFARLRRRRAAESFVAAAMWPRVLPPDSPERFWIKTALWESALILGLVALAGPRFGAYYEEIRPRGSDLYVLIDVSRSMLAQDVAPSRLGRAKADVSSLLNRLKGERVGLVAFAGKAVVKSPLTTDYDFYRRSLEELDTNSAPRGGTAIGDAIRKALEVFPADADRDQAILLITDGDDQESYPLDAAALAAERHVTIFTVGLGDADQGARIPGAKDAKNFVEYEGKQVWSKLNNSVLKDIALKTNGVFVPAGTRAYDLGELYDTYLKNRRGAEGKEQKRLRLSEQFQIFLGIAILLLLGEILIRSYPPPVEESSAPKLASVPKRKIVAGTAAALCFACFHAAHAGDAHAAVREGLELYKNDKFDEAREKFAAANENLSKEEQEKAAIIAFDLACAYHRKGDTEHARDEYLKAGLAREGKLASEAHFNLGQLTAEAARTLAGEHPEAVEPDKRKEIIDKLMDAARSFRQSLERQPGHEGARKNLELVRQWIKVYTDKWRALDRQKRRDETNLAQFVEYLVKTENGLRESVKQMTPTATRDAFAEHKRVQDELLEEIPVLKEKIVKEVTPPPQQAAQPGQPPQPAPPQMDPKQVEEAIKTLQGWAEDAGKKMDAASNKLHAREPSPAATEQKNAVVELEKIWEAVIPFHPLLARDLDEQTKIVHTLRPETSDEDGKDEKKDDKDKKEPPKDKPFPLINPLATLTDEQLAQIVEDQENTLRRTAYLKPKAEMELERAEKTPQQPQPVPPPPDPKDPNAKKNAPPDPEKIKEGYKKAIELAPKAVEKMTKALQSLRDKRTDVAYPDAEEARRILEEIMKAQPKNENQDKNQDQKNKDQKDQDKKEQEKKDQEKKDQDKKDDKDKDKDKDKKDEKKEQKQDQKEEKKELSQDKIEDALRKVREREKQKHDRDKEMKARIYGQVPVDKDW